MPRPFLLAVALLLSACGDLAVLPLVAPPSAPDAPRSAIREVIRLQLDSRNTERPPEPVPAVEADQLLTLQQLPAIAGGRRGDAGRGAR